MGNLNSTPSGHLIVSNVAGVNTTYPRESLPNQGHHLLRYAPPVSSSNVSLARNDGRDFHNAIDSNNGSNVIDCHGANSLSSAIANQVMHQTAIANENQITNKIANIIASTIPTIVASVMSADSQVPANTTASTIATTSTASGERKKRRKQKENEKRKMKRQERINCFKDFKKHWKTHKGSEINDACAGTEEQNPNTMDVDKLPDQNQSSLSKTTSSDSTAVSVTNHKSSTITPCPVFTSISVQESLPTKSLNAFACDNNTSNAVPCDNNTTTNRKVSPTRNSNLELSSKISRAITKHGWEEKESYSTGWGSGSPCRVPNPGADWAKSFRRDTDTHSYGKWTPNLNVDSNGKAIDNNSKTSKVSAPPRSNDNVIRANKTTSTELSSKNDSNVSSNPSSTKVSHNISEHKKYSSSQKTY